MSDSLALVRFPDGDLRAAYFAEDVGVVVPLLFPVEQREDVLLRGVQDLMREVGSLDLDQPEPDDAEWVEIWVGGPDARWWLGRASRSLGLLVEGIDPTTPESTPGGVMPLPREVHKGVPDWVPADWRSGPGVS
jgi:hypothetical protein